MANPYPIVCTHCGYTGLSKRIVPGSNLLGCALLLLFVLPGLIYAVWQQTKSAQGCPQCGHTDTIVPANSPRGRAILAEQGKAPKP